MTLVQSETELTTAATDALLGIICLALATWLLATPTAAPWRRNVWVAVLLLMSVGSLLGAVAHGLVMSEGILALLWKPLYLALGLAVALVVVGAMYDWAGESAASRLLPWAIGAGVLFTLVTQFMGGAFALFIVYEGVATLTALAIYIVLSSRGSLPGAGGIALGILVSLVAAVVQVTTLKARMGVSVDHNGLFHLIQTVGAIVMTMGVRAGF